MRCIAAPPLPPHTHIFFFCLRELLCAPGVVNTNDFVFSGGTQARSRDTVKHRLGGTQTWWSIDTVDHRHDGTDKSPVSGGT